MTQLDLSATQLDHSKFELQPLVLSYAQYCRYRAALRRVERCADGPAARALLASACGVPYPRLAASRVLFCRDTADSPVLQRHRARLGHLGQILYHMKLNLALIVENAAVFMLWIKFLQ